MYQTYRSCVQSCVQSCLRGQSGIRQTSRAQPNRTEFLPPLLRIHATREGCYLVAGRGCWLPPEGTGWGGGGRKRITTYVEMMVFPDDVGAQTMAECFLSTSRNTRFCHSSSFQPVVNRDRGGRLIHTHITDTHEKHK